MNPMRNTSKKIAAITGASAAAVALAATGAFAAANFSGSDSSTSTVAASSANSSQGTSEGNTTVSTASLTSALSNIDTHVDDDDLTWDASEEKTITLSDSGSTSSADSVTVDGSTITITEGGVYRVSGSLTNGSLVVNVAKDQAVTLVFDGAQIKNESGPAVSVIEADEVRIVVEEGTQNSVADGASYEVADDATPVAAIASNADLTIAGSGTLSVAGNTNDGINTKDGLAIYNDVTLEVTSVDDGIRGKDYIVIDGATINVDAKDDAIKSDNAEDDDRGWVLVKSGNITINAGDDGLKGEQGLEVADGTVNVESSVEGFEAMYLTVSGGTVNITASDDGMNATVAEVSTDSSSDSATATERSTQAQQGPGGMGGEANDGSELTISGGKITINAGFDGLDSNGSIAITGGDITITSAQNGGDAPVDANGDITFENATLVANGTAITSVDQLGTAMGGGPGGMGGQGAPPQGNQSGQQAPGQQQGSTDSGSGNS